MNLQHSINKKTVDFKESSQFKYYHKIMKLLGLSCKIFQMLASFLTSYNKLFGLLIFLKIQLIKMNTRFIGWEPFEFSLSKVKKDLFVFLTEFQRELMFLSLILSCHYIVFGNYFNSTINYFIVLL